MLSVRLTSGDKRIERCKIVIAIDLTFHHMSFNYPQVFISLIIIKTTFN